MRTWFNALPQRHHAEAASFSWVSFRTVPFNDKKRVPVPELPGTPYALAN